MNTTEATASTPRVPAIVTQFRTELDQMEPQFALVLPPDIRPGAFTRVIRTATMREPRLLACDRQSLISACMQAAVDGLMPDGREGVLLPFASDEDDGGRGASMGKKVTWVPMIFGIRKKVLNSKLLADWNVQAVQEGDLFDYELGDRPYIRHKPALTGGRTRRLIAVYSIATYPDGTKSYEIMNADAVNDIRKLSRAKKGPWSNPVFFVEMARKTCARLHSKQLPMSTDLDLILRRQDAMTSLERREDDHAPRREQVSGPRPSMQSTLEYFASAPGTSPSAPSTPDAEPPPADKSDESRADSPQPAGERDQGDLLGDQGQKTAPKAQAQAAPSPKTPEEYVAMARTHIDAAKTKDEAARLEPWFVSDQQRALRGQVGMQREHTDEVRGLITAKITSFKK